MSLSSKEFSISKIQLDSIVLAKVKHKLLDGSASQRTQNAYKALITTATKLLSLNNPTVMDKTIVPPSGNKHDYLSISRYWWPNPEVSNGLPWIRIDGETNPDTQTDAVDRKRLGTMTRGVKSLSLAYYFSEDECYAKKAVDMLKTWFLDDATRMNPHLEYAQSVPGYSKGRSSGVIDGQSIAAVVPDAVVILSNSVHWTQKDTKRINQWLTDYVTWLTESNFGKKENNQNNNHASWYKYQVASLALYLGNDTLAKEMVALAQESLENQLDATGQQTHEIARTRSFFYSCYNLNALTSIAMVGDKLGMDMWHYKTKDHKSLTLAINYLAPVIKGEVWPYTDIHGTDVTDLLTALARMSLYAASNEMSSLLFKTIAILVEKEQTTGKKNEDLQALSLTSSLFL
jgi:hypothetical protein